MNFFQSIIKKDRRFHSTERVADLGLLEPTLRHKVQAIIAEAEQRGVDFMVFETFRSRERQGKLFKQGATKLKAVGVHHFGLACDLVKSVDGQPSWKGSFALLGELAHKHELVWGGDWKGFVDAVHIQRCPLNKQKELFAGTWYPEHEDVESEPEDVTEQAPEAPIKNGEVVEPAETTSEKIITTTTTETPNATVEKKSIVSTIAEHATVKEVASAGVSKLGNRVATGLATGSATSVLSGFFERNMGLIIFGCVLIVLAAAIVGVVMWHRSTKEKKLADISSDKQKDDVIFVEKKHGT